MNILSLMRKTDLTGAESSSFFLFSNSQDKQTYTISFENMLVDILQYVSDGVVGGADTQIQFNNNGVFEGSPNFTWDYNANELYVTGTIVATGAITGASFNSVVLNATGAATNFLNEDGAYTVPPLNAAGADNRVQYSKTGLLNGDPNFTWNDITDVLNVTGAITATTFNGVALTTAGAVTNFLNEQGAYSVPPVTPATPPAGANTEVQFNNSGAFGASERLKWNGLTFNVGSLTQPGVLNVGNNIVMGISDAVGNVGGYFTGIGQDDIATKNFKWLNQSQVEVFAIDNLGDVTATNFNGVPLTTAGLTTAYLAADGNYTVPSGVLPGGADYQIQFNNAGAFGVDSSFYYKTALKELTINGLDDLGARVVNLTNLSLVPVFEVDTLGNVDALGTVTATLFDGNLNNEDLIGLTQVVPGTIITAAIANDQDNWDPTGFATANLIRVDVSGNRNISGLVAPPAGVNRIIIISNTASTSGQIVFESNSNASLPENRFLLRDDNDRQMRINEGTSFYYDHIDLRWRQLTQIG